MATTDPILQALIDNLTEEVKQVLPLIAQNGGYGIMNITYKEGAIYEVAVTLTKRGKSKKADALKSTL